MDTMQERLQAVKSRIAAASHACGRDPRDIVLVAVSKAFSADAIRVLRAAGQRDFGENYAQEAAGKQAALAGCDLVWHFIGPLQSNKTRAIAHRVHWGRSVDRLKPPERLAAQRPAALPPLQICLQVNVSGERSKAGVAPEDLPALVRAVAPLPRLQLRGLMAIPEPSDDA